MGDLALMAAFVRALPLMDRERLAAGPCVEGDGRSCTVCNVLHDEGYATGHYRVGERQAPDWVLNWHRSDALRCMAIYGAAAASLEEAVPRSEAEALAEALERALDLASRDDADYWRDESAVSDLNAQAAVLADFRSRHPKETP